MEIGNIENLELYVDKEVEYKNGNTKIKRVPLENDLDIGETAYFRNSERNKVVKHDENNYIFYRFDEIQTHIEDYDSGYSIEDISREINSNLDYDVEYAVDRVNLVNDLIEKNEWIYDLLSSNRIIQKEQKKKSDFLAEDQKLDKEIEKISNYILHPKFNNKESKDYFAELREGYEYLRCKSSKTEQEIKEMMSLKDEIDLVNQRILTNSKIRTNKLRERLILNGSKNTKNNEENNEEKKDESTLGEIESEFTTEKSVIKNFGKEIEFGVDYWDKMGFSKEGKDFRVGVLNVYEESLELLNDRLGYGEPEEEREKIQEKTLSKLQPITYQTTKGKLFTLTPEIRLSKLKRLYSELKSDYYRAKEILALPIEFKQVDPAFPKYDFNYDTWYEDDSGKIKELSKNTILFSNVNTYKGLILSYYDLKEKYMDDFHDDMWAILLVFEELVSKTDLNEEEHFVINSIMKDNMRKEVIDSYKKEFGKKISMKTVSNWVNRVIPNKILNTYLHSVDEWLYTYKLKGRFKQCNKCGEIKLISNDRYFRKRSIKVGDGHYNQCRNCESAKKG